MPEVGGMSDQPPRLRRPLVGVALSFAAGVAGARWFDAPGVDRGAWLAAVAVAVALLAGSLAARGAWRWQDSILTGLLWSAVAVAAAAYTLARVDRDAGSLAAWDGQTVTLVGVIEGEPDVGENRATYVVRVEEVDRRAVRGRVRLGDYRRGGRRFQAGDRIRAPVSVRRPRSAANPGEFDASAHLARQGIYFEASLNPGGRIERVGSEARGIAALAAAIRARLEDALRNALPAEPAALSAGLLFGSRAALKESLIADFRTAGILHLLAVSGGNVAFVAMPTLLALRRLGIPRNAAFAATGTVVVVFVLVTGATPSVVRAGAMACTALLGAGAGRRADPLAALAAAGLLQLTWQPLVLFDAGFQLSFAATGGILAFARAWSARSARLTGGAEEERSPPVPTASSRFRAALARAGRRALAAAGAAAAVTLAAQVGVLPVQAHYFGSVSLAALPANLVAMPLVAALVPVAGALCGASLILPALAAPLAPAVEGLTAALTFTARVAARLPFAEAVVVPPGPWVTGAYALSFLYFAGWWRPPGLPPAAAWRPRTYALAALGVATAAVWWLALQPRNRLEVVFLARHGEVVFIRFPRGATALIDGRRGASGGEDLPWEPFLRRSGVFQPDLVLRLAAHPEGPAGRRAEGSPSGGSVPLDGRDLSPEAEVGLWPLPIADGDAIPLLIRYGDVAIVLADRGGEAEEDAILTALGDRPPPFVALRPGRGGAAAVGEAFVAALRPSLIVLQSGGTAGRAAEAALRWTTVPHARVVRTDLSGALTVRSNGQTIIEEEFLAQPVSPSMR